MSYPHGAYQGLCARCSTPSPAGTPPPGGPSGHRAHTAIGYAQKAAANYQPYAESPVQTKQINSFSLNVTICASYTCVRSSEAIGPPRRAPVRSGVARDIGGAPVNCKSAP